MSRKKILIIYPSMIIGGSTTSLLSLLNCLDPQKYEINLQLFRNEGPLLDAIPEFVHLLPEAEHYKGIIGRFLKLIICFFTGYYFKALFTNLKRGEIGLSRELLGDFQVKYLTRKSMQKYHVAISFLEGWSNRYLAYKVEAAKKYAWIHSTFSKTTANPQAEYPWMKKVDRIVFVADACKKIFCQEAPAFADKAVVLLNITDDRIIRKRSMHIERLDKDYERFEKATCFKIITICRLIISTKGLDRIVTCAKRLKAAGKSFLWYIVGDGEDKESLLRMIQNNNVGDCLVPIGARINPYPFLKASDVMCMPSRYEGMPMTVTESMILGVPPIVTSYLSAHEQIKNENEGLIVENKDDAAFPVLMDMIEYPKRVLSMRSYLGKHTYGNCSYIRIIENELLN